MLASLGNKSALGIATTTISLAADAENRGGKLVPAARKCELSLKLHNYLLRDRHGGLPQPISVVHDRIRHLTRRLQLGRGLGHDHQHKPTAHDGSVDLRGLLLAIRPGGQSTGADSNADASPFLCICAISFFF